MLDGAHSATPGGQPVGQRDTPKPLAVHATTIPGLLLIDLPVHRDARGWFKENWQREKLLAFGLPDFGPVQQNIAYNRARGTTRGIHAEPWDKYVSVATGRVFGAWVDLRAGASFGQVFTAEIGPDTAVFVPRGVGNSYQTLEHDTAYVYLVNAHWSAEAQRAYTFLNLADETAAIDWPIALAEAQLSANDLAHPPLTAVTPMRPRRTLVLGANGQLGRALRTAVPEAAFADRTRIDLRDPRSLDTVRWSDYDTVINAAAYTAVDQAETAEGRVACWQTNVTGVARLARLAADHRLTLVHISSDYVFDGASERDYREDDPVSPLGVYGQSKAAGEAIVATVPHHYIVRTSWVIGDGANFVRTMATLAARGATPKVVNDQIGRLTFTEDLAAGIVHLLRVDAPHGVYHLSNTGAPSSWADIARLVYKHTGHHPEAVSGVTTAEYFASNKQAAPRPRHSGLALDKIIATGFTPRDASVALRAYLSTQPGRAATGDASR